MSSAFSFQPGLPSFLNDSSNSKSSLSSLLEILSPSHTDIENSFNYQSMTRSKLTSSYAIFQKNKPHIANNIKYIVISDGVDEEEAIQLFHSWFSELNNIIGGIWYKDNLFHFYQNFKGEVIPVKGFKEYSTDKETIDNPPKNDASELTSILLALHNYIYANDGHSSYEAFSEILKIMFVKIQDEQQSKNYVNRRFYVTDQEFKSAMAGIEDEKSSNMYNRINQILIDAKRDYPDIFGPSDSFNLKLSTLAFIVAELQKLNFSSLQYDIKGIAFQKIVSAAHRGERGQFITPYPIVRLMVSFLYPKSGEIILDPACGTGSFLIEALRYLNFFSSSRVIDCSKNLYGIEINQAVARVAKMQMILFDGKPKNISCQDSLIPQMPKEWNRFQQADVILTNPPFGTQGKIVQSKILSNYSLANKWTKDNTIWHRNTQKLNGQSPEVLFIERCLQLLKNGGRMGIVLPNGILENISQGYIRQFIRDNADVLSVVSLPPETFTPHGTGVRASILFLQKKIETTSASNQVFFGMINKIGYEGGKHSEPIYKIDQQGNIIKDKQGNPLLDEDISEIIDRYLHFKSGDKIENNQTTFVLSNESVIDRFDLNYYSPKYTSLITELNNLGAVPLKSVAKIIQKKSALLKSPEKKIRYIELSDIDPSYPEIINATELYVHEAPSRASYEVKTGDIITAVSGNSTGTSSHVTAYVTQEYDGCICSNGFRVIQATHVDPYYLLSFMRTGLFLKQVFRYRTGAAIPSINDSDLANILILLPTTEKQETVAKKVKNSLKLRKEATSDFRQILEELQMSLSH